MMSLEELPHWREEFFGRVVATNGCFDILHAGHVRFLRQAARLGDCLVVGINDDDGVRRLKGAFRPVNSARDRAEVLAALSCVDHVVVFHGASAVEFLRRSAPCVWAKGGDYTTASLCPRELATVEAGGGKSVLCDVARGYSTTNIIRRCHP